jgi:Zn-dependent protease
MQLSFPLGKIPVSIHVSFFIMTLLLGAGMAARDLTVIVVWIGVVLVSVLLHELGHALMGRLFGLTPRIDLHGMGGTTSWAHKDVSAPKKILISLAGPFVGIVLGMAIKTVAESGAIELSQRASLAISMVVFVNLYWGLLNLLPILPLDGGNVMSQTFAIATGGGGQRAAHIVSIAVAVAGGGYALVTGGTGNWWPALLAGMLAYQNFRALVPERRPPANPPAPSSRW